jgi:hypothetical protein
MGTRPRCGATRTWSMPDDTLLAALADSALLDNVDDFKYLYFFGLAVDFVGHPGGLALLGRLSRWSR